MTIYSLDVLLSPNLEPVHFSRSHSVTSWPAYRFLRRQIRWSGIAVFLIIFHSLLWSRVQGFSILNKADAFLELSSFFCDPTDIGNLFFGSSALSKSLLSIWKSLVHLLLKTHLRNFEHSFASMWDECNFWSFECSLAWCFFGMRMKTELSSPVATAEFSKCAVILSVALSRPYLLEFEIVQLESHQLL